MYHFTEIEALDFIESIKQPFVVIRGIDNVIDKDSLLNERLVHSALEKVLLAAKLIKNKYEYIEDEFDFVFVEKIGDKKSGKNDDLIVFTNVYQFRKLKQLLAITSNKKPYFMSESKYIKYLQCRKANRC